MKDLLILVAKGVALLLEDAGDYDLLVQEIVAEIVALEEGT